MKISFLPLSPIYPVSAPPPAPLGTNFIDFVRIFPKHIYENTSIHDTYIHSFLPFNKKFTDTILHIASFCSTVFLGHSHESSS